MTEAPTWRRDRVCLGETYRSRTRAEVRALAKLRRDNGPSGGHKVSLNTVRHLVADRGFKSQLMFAGSWSPVQCSCHVPLRAHSSPMPSVQTSGEATVASERL